MGIYDIWERKTPHLTLGEKEIVSLAILIDQQNLLETKAHAFTCLKIGVGKQRIMELLVFLTLYVGVPKVVFAFKSVKEAIEEYEKGEKRQG